MAAGLELVLRTVWLEQGWAEDSPGRPLVEIMQLGPLEFMAAINPDSHELDDV